MPVTDLHKEAKVDGIHVSETMMQFATMCLEPLPEDRIKSMTDVKSHPFLADIDFKNWGSIPPQFKPSGGANVSKEAKGQDMMDAFGEDLIEKVSVGISESEEGAS